MRQTFDRNVSLLEQRMRVAGAKQVGRKHDHRRGPGKAKEMSMRRAKNISDKKARIWKRFSLAVSAFFAGKSDQYPRKPEA